jgi:hypothetical protein
MGMRVHNQNRAPQDVVFSLSSLSAQAVHRFIHR